MRTPPFRLALLAAVAAVAVAPAMAQTAAAADAAAASLPAVKATARTATQDDTVTREELQQRQARDLTDLYRLDPEIAVGGGGSAFAQKIYIRGMEESLLDLSIDGARQNGKVYHHQTALVLDPQLIKSVEVEKGTAAASAGPGALGGAIRLYTVDAADLLRAGQTAGASGSLGVFSNDGWRAGVNVYGLAGGWDLLFSSTREDTGSYDDGHGERVANSGGERGNGLAKIGWAPADGHRVVASWQRSVDDGIRNSRANMVGFGHPVLPNEPIPQELARDTGSLRWEARRLGWADKLDATLYRTEIETDRTTSAGRRYGETLDTTGVDLELQKAVGAQLLKAGVNWRDDETASRNVEDRFGNTGSGREDARVAGVWVEGVGELGPVEIAAGLRYDDYAYEDNHGQRYDADGFSPSVSARWRVGDTLVLKAGHARALRGVGLKEAFMLDIARWRNAAAIDAERAENNEIGFEWTMQPGVTVSANVYRQTIRDYVTTLACPGVTVGCRDNAGTARIEGYELGAGWRRGAWNGRVAVADAKPELNGRAFNDGDLGLGVATGRTWLASLGYRFAAPRVELGWTGRFVEAIDYTPIGAPTTTLTKAGHGVHDVQLSWQPREDDRLRLNLAVRNLLDQHYYEQATYAYNGAQGKVLGYPEPGRDLRVEVQWRY